MGRPAVPGSTRAPTVPRSTRSVRLRLAVAAVAMVAGLAGCASRPIRPSAGMVDRETSRSFKRAYDAWHSMTTSIATEKLIREARSRCRPLEPLPAGQQVWTWTCRIAYDSRAGSKGVAFYHVRIDPRGCFSARSESFSVAVFERVLGRLSRNPLAYFNACPLQLTGAPPEAPPAARSRPHAAPRSRPALRGYLGPHRPRALPGPLGPP